jgi:translation initiation factor IF-2
MVVGFSVSTPRSIETLAAQNDVAICSSNIIYRLMEDIKDRVIARLPVIVETRVTGEATVLQLFDIHLKAKQTKQVAGCRVINGLVEKSKFAKVVRDGVTIHEGLSPQPTTTITFSEFIHRYLGHNATFEKGCHRSAKGLRMWS